MVEEVKNQILSRNRLRTHPKKISEMTKEERILTARMISESE